jgi:hypothetical protein
MPLFLGELAHSIHKRLDLFEIFKFVFFAQVVLIHNFPPLDFGSEFCNLLTG